jgi:hypothetical protein
LRSFPKGVQCCGWFSALRSFFGHAFFGPSHSIFFVRVVFSSVPLLSSSFGVGAHTALIWYVPSSKVSLGLLSWSVFLRGFWMSRVFGIPVYCKKAFRASL